MTHDIDPQVVDRAVEAVQAYWRWQQETIEPLRVFHRRLRRIRREMQLMMPKGNRPIDPALEERLEELRKEETVAMRERARYLRTHRQPRTADSIIEEYAAGSTRLHKEICDLVTERIRAIKGRDVLAEAS